MKCVADVMTRDLIELEPGITLREAVALFDRKMISGAPVVSPEGALLGVLSRTDITSKLLRDGTLASLETPVEEAMTPFVFRLMPTDSLSRVLEVMVTARIHRVIITQGERPVGIVTTLDLLEEYRQSVQG